MKDIVARATIKTTSFFNTGFIHISDESIEGFLSMDYINIILDGKNMVLNMIENSIYIDSERIFHHDIYSSSYSCSFRYDNLYIPDEYTLYDEDKNVLTLSIESIVDDYEVKTIVLNGIKQKKEQLF